jgi:hypothetical protein
MIHENFEELALFSWCGIIVLLFCGALHVGVS